MQTNVQDFPAVDAWAEPTPAADAPPAGAHPDSSPEITEHTRRALFLATVARAIDLDGLPAPMSIDFSLPQYRSVKMRMNDNATSDVDDWAAHIGVEATRGPDTFTTNRPWQSYDAGPAEFGGFTLRIWCADDVDEEV
jgi:hypothetical protein